MNKHEALIEYIKQYPQLHSWLYFNSLIETPKTVGVILDSDNLIKQYIDGCQKREYIFNINMCQIYDTDTSDINTKAIDETTNFVNWIKAQDRAENYPSFANCTVKEIECLTDTPLMRIDSENRRAVYVLQIKITYEEELS